MESALLLSMPIVFYFLNRLRGATMKSIIGSDFFIKNGAIFAILGILIYIGLLTNNWLCALITAGGYALGESFGWSKYVRQIREWGNDAYQDHYNNHEKQRDTGKINGIHWIASLFAKEHKDFTRYGQVSMVLRGMWWFIPVYGPLVYFNVITLPIAAASVVALGFLFPLVYWTFMPHNPRGPFGGNLGFAGGEEKMYGLIYGAVIALSFYLSGMV
jgi:hypothetical protein